MCYSVYFPSCADTETTYVTRPQTNMWISMTIRLITLMFKWMELEWFWIAYTIILIWFELLYTFTKRIVNLLKWLILINAAYVWQLLLTHL